MNERTDDIGNTSLTGIVPVRVDDPRALDTLSSLGLSPSFPSLLKGLNDVVAKRDTQFQGVRITFSPEKNQPVPKLEIKRGNENQVIIDVDKDESGDPSKSKVRLRILGNAFRGIASFSLGELQDLLSVITPENKDVRVYQFSSLTEKILSEPEDFFKLSIDDLDKLCRDSKGYFREGDLFVVRSFAEEQGTGLKDWINSPNLESPGIFTFFLSQHPIQGIQERRVILQDFCYLGSAGEAESALNRIISFFGKKQN